MNKLEILSRRDFLQLTAVAAGGTMLGACGGDASRTAAPSGQSTAEVSAAPTTASDTSTPAPTAPAQAANTPASATANATAIQTAGNYKQAPVLDRMQNLPPVEERLPRNPYVVPHEWLQPGKYGGHLRMASSDATGMSEFVQQSMYGHSILRWLKDCLEIGPGLAESWSTNEDATEWTFNFREGLKWSDGEPWTTADIMFWWEDMVLNEEHPAGPPDEARSGNGTLAKFKAVDDLTLQLTFDAPAPLTADRIAMWVNRGVGPDWMQPRHYMEQFHPKYNKQVGQDWAATFDQKKDFATNPECPVTTGWKIKSYNEGVSTVWERNPYYWCVDKDGNQLPFIDGLTMSYVQNPEVLKLRFAEGRADYVHGAHSGLGLSDVATLRKAEPRNNLEVRFWDSGSGTGSMFFLNQDYQDANVRKLFRNAKFRQALSHAFNREDVRKTVYFNQGELTTGTLSPKGIEYNVNDEGREIYQQWRDSYVEYSPERANQLLVEIGMKKGPNGMRTLPGGGKFTLRLEYGAPGSFEHVRKNELLARDLQAVGIDARLNPVPPDTFSDQWAQGKFMTNTAWEVGGVPNHFVQPEWVVPIESTRWAPLQGRFYSMRGTPEEKQGQHRDPYKRTPPRMEPEEGSPVDRLWKLYDRARVEPDAMKRHRLAWDIDRIHMEDGPFFMGPIANYPQIVLVHEELRNVPHREDLAQGGWVNPWIYPTPAVYDPEAYYWDNPEAHS